MRIKHPIPSNISTHSQKKGSMFAICGDGYAAVAVDTDLSEASKQHQQRQNKLFSITENSIFASNGCTCYTIPLIQEARVHLNESVALYEDLSVRTEKAIEILGRMTTTRATQFDNMNNIVITLTNGIGHIYLCNATGDMRTVNGWLSGCGSEFLSETLKEFSSNDLKLVIDYITSRFMILATTQSPELCNDTLHIGVLTEKGVKVIEQALR